MKKFFKNLIYGVVFSLLLLTGIFSYSAINKANAVDSQAETSHTVNFYAEDNETILYSVEVPNGMSLQDLQDNNLIDDSIFSQTIQQSSVVYNKWYSNRVSSANCYWSNSENGFTYTTAYAWSGINYAFEFSDELTDVYYLTLNARLVSGLPRLGIYTRYYNDTGSVVDKSVHYVLNSSLTSEFKTFTLVIPRYEDFAFCSVNLWHNSSDTTNISTYEFNYINLTTQNTNYFNEDYVLRAYQNNGGNVGSNFEWSESPTSSSRFNFDLPITKDINLYGYNFNGQTINYTGEISSDYGNLANYAIKNVEYLQVDGFLLYHFVIDTDDVNFINLSDYFIMLQVPNNSLSSETVCDSVYIDSFDSTQVFNFFVYSELPATTGSSGGYVGAISCKNSGSFYTLHLFPNRGKVHVYFSLADFNFSSRTDFTLTSDDSSLSVDTRFYDNLNYVVDMNSNTNFSFGFNLYHGIDDESSFNYRFLSSIINGDFENDDYLNVQYYDSTSSSRFIVSYVLDNSGWTHFATYDVQRFIAYVIAYYDYSSLVNFNVDSFFFFIHRPIQRVDNTLVIYNFDYYNLLYSTKFVNYQLQADGNLYNVNYNGLIPNDYFIYISNEDVINTVFDEYVYLFMEFNNNILNLSFDSNDYYNCFMGFDFNFTYYVQPLVSNSGVYSYTFDKPDYVSMLTSTPPFFDILAAAENILIFFMFYCPVVSDLISLMQFDLFFGSLIKIFDIFVASGIGDFILSCFAFLIFWSILKGMFPSLISSSSGWSNFGAMDEIQDTVGYVRKQNRLRKEKLVAANRPYKPYHHKSSLKSKSRHRVNNLRSLTSNLYPRSKSRQNYAQHNYTKKQLNSVIDNLDDIDI